MKRFNTLFTRFLTILTIATIGLIGSYRDEFSELHSYGS